MNILTSDPTLSKLNLWQTIPTILIIRTFDRKGEWAIEVIFEGGVKAITSATADEVAAIESDLSDRGWQITPSIFSNGVNAKPPVEDPQGGLAEPCDCGMLFASSAGMWVDDYSIEPVTL